MTPNYDKNSNLVPVFVRGLMIEPEMFSAIPDDNLRGCLRILLHLKHRGLKSQERGPNNGLSVEEQLAADLIRFVPVIVFNFPQIVYVFMFPSFYF